MAIVMAILTYLMGTQRTGDLDASVRLNLPRLHLPMVRFGGWNRLAT